MSRDLLLAGIETRETQQYNYRGVYCMDCVVNYAYLQTRKHDNQMSAIDSL